MRLNATTHIRGPSITLVPYRARHVARYHGWMEDAALREATASERLTAEEEAEMQRSWRQDGDKLTFLIRLDAWGGGDAALVGDVNLFLSAHEGGAGGVQGECEVMVAEEEARRRGVAREAMVLMLAYAVPRLQIERVEAKIGLDNTASLALFGSAPLGLVEESRAEIFNEATLARTTDDAWLQELAKAFPSSVDEEASDSDD